MSKSSPEWDMLLSAAQKNLSDRIREMILTDGVDPSYSNAVGQSALHIAALWGNVESVSALIELGANINAQNNLTGASPLHMAAQSHKATIDARLKVIDILIAAGALPDQADNYGALPITLLEKSNEGKKLDEDTRLMMSKLRPQQPKIHQAIIDRDLSFLENLLSDGTLDVNSTFQSETPLSVAIRNFIESITLATQKSNESTEIIVSIIKLLLMKGADPNCVIIETTDAVDDNVKEPAIHKLVSTLRERYRIIKQSDTTDYIVTMLRELIGLLVTSGSNIPSDTTLLLHQAARLNEIPLAIFLIEEIKIDPNTKGRQGMTPLHLAARSGKVEILQLLLNRPGIDVNVTDDQGKTAMYYATVNEKDEAIRLLEPFSCS